MRDILTANMREAFKMILDWLEMEEVESEKERRNEIKK